ncbi:restriction endonuclease subunit S [Patescibacteria group bacterium]|nr:restriction endonuclease subunit S [Patescibacteria group bacterium]MBU4481567.1 restriction endonuclease subunit S [Patescibacteria group bacterium]
MITYPIIQKSKLEGGLRLDAEYYQPEYLDLIKNFNNLGAVPIGDIVINPKRKFKPQKDKVFQYIEISEVDLSTGEYNKAEILGENAPDRAQWIIQTNDVILSSVEGSLEKVALVGKEQEGYLASNGFFQFRSKDILQEVLLILAKSFILQMQFEKETAGTILTAVPKEAVKNIIVPKINKSTQQKIADLVQKSHKARKKAKRLLAKAKQSVENLIEG